MKFYIKSMENHISTESNSNLIDVSDKTEKSKKETSISLTDMVEEIVKNCPLKDYIYLKADEVVSSNSCIKQLSIEGRVSKEIEAEANQLQVQLVEKITNQLESNVNMSQFWKVEVGLREGEKLPEIEAYNSESEKVMVSHEKGTVLVIGFWSVWDELANFLDSQAQLMKSVVEGKVEGVTKNRLKYICISGEEHFSEWKKVADAINLNNNIPQFHNKHIYEIVGISQVPSTLVVDTEGIIRYLGIHKNLNLENTVKNLLTNEKGVVKAEEALPDTNPNAWWLDMDPESKVDIIRNFNIQLRTLGSRSCQFVVLTQHFYQPSGLKTNTIPIFMGTMFENEYDIVQNFAIDLQTNWNFNNFQFNCKVLSFY